MHRVLRVIAFAAVAATLAVSWPVAASAQRHPPDNPPSAGRADPRSAPRRPEARPPVHRGSVVFIGGYFYDPYFGPYPWWRPVVYPYPYYPAYDGRATVRIIATPEEAAVYVDGFYAGIVDDFNGFFQGLPVTPGGHDVVLYLSGYRTIHRRLYLAAGSTFKVHETMEPVGPGEVSEPPAVAPPLPAPPKGTFLPPRTSSGSAAPGTRAAGNPAIGTLSLRVQPATAEVWIDGERWMSSDGGAYIVELPAGPHHLEVVSRGYRGFLTDVNVAAAEITQLNVGLTPQR